MSWYDTNSKPLKDNQFVGGSSPPARIICHCSSVGRALQDNVQAVIGSSPISGKLIFHEDAIASVVSGVSGWKSSKYKGPSKGVQQRT